MLVALASLVDVRRAAGHGVIDQLNNPPAVMTFSCGAGGVPLGQTFTPAAGSVVAVDLYLRAGGAFPPDGLILEVELLGPAGEALGQATTRIVGPIAAGTAVTAHFDFALPLPVTPGAVHRIIWPSSLPSELSWFGTDGDPYPRGVALGCNGQPVAGRDFNFATYAPAPATAATPSTTAPASATPAHTATAALTATPTTVPSPTPTPPVCPQILRRVPAADIAAALAAPHTINGYNQLERPGLPPGPRNRRRTWLSISQLARPYDRFWNGLIWRAGCP
jgi:hypothetical protein